MKKKLLSLVLAATMVASLTACGGSGSESTTKAPETDAPETTTEAPKAAEAPEGAVAYFTFDDTVDACTPVSVGLNAAEKAAWTFDAGKKGNALNVNAEGDDIGLATGVNIGTGSYTIGFWAKANSCVFATPLVWIGKKDQSVEAWNGIWQGFSDNWAGGTSGAGSNDASGARVGITASFNGAGPVGFDWTYITMTVDVENNYTCALYVDGHQIFAKEGFAALTEDADLYIGANYWDKPCNFLIDELRVYDRVLTEDEVSDLFKASK